MQHPTPSPASSAVRSITCYLDFISPYAWLAFERLPHALEGVSFSMQYRPVVLGAVLQHHGQLGPAEIPAKRDWTYRQVMWLAQAQGVNLDMPASHPFNSLPLSRLALACAAPGESGTCNRWVCETVFRHVWEGGEDAVAPARLQTLADSLKPSRDWQGEHSEAIKSELRQNTSGALADGIFGVPSFKVDGKLFWGLDALPMLRAYLLGDAWFDGPAWDDARTVGAGVVRRRDPPARA